MNTIEEIRYWNVDVLIECCEGVTMELVAELNEVAPRAYQEGGVALSTAYRKLSPQGRKAVRTALLAREAYLDKFSVGG